MLGRQNGCGVRTLWGWPLSRVHYAETLRLWREKFTAHQDHVRSLGLDHTFCRLRMLITKDTAP